MLIDHTGGFPLVSYSTATCSCTVVSGLKLIFGSYMDTCSVWGFRFLMVVCLISNTLKFRAIRSILVIKWKLGISIPSQSLGFLWDNLGHVLNHVACILLFPLFFCQIFLIGESIIMYSLYTISQCDFFFVRFNGSFKVTFNWCFDW